MTRYCMCVSYDGSGFCGWQRQRGLRSVQGCIEEGLSRLHGNNQVNVYASSRTDAGVHAEGQMVSFDSDRGYDELRLRYSLNALMPRDIYIRDLFVVSDDFSPRHASCGKHYRYLLWEGHFVPPFLLNRVMRVRPLDIEAMIASSRCLLGEHDFSSFRASGCQSKSPMRSLWSVDIRRVDGGVWSYGIEGEEGHMIEIDVKGDAFLKQMVRNIVGCLLEVGSGRREVSWIEEVMSARCREAGGETALACGLSLLKVFGIGRGEHV